MYTEHLKLGWQSLSPIYIILYYRYPTENTHQNQIVWLKGTVSVISSDSPCKDGNARFPKLCPIQVWIRYPYFFSLHCLFSFVVSLQKWNAHFLFIWNTAEIHRNNHLSSQKNDAIFRNFDRIKVFKGTVVYRYIAIFAWRFAWTYAYSPFKEYNFKVINIQGLRCKD